jgi:uncharacterized protein (TIGR00645 family)
MDTSPQTSPPSSSEGEEKPERLENIILKSRFLLAPFYLMLLWGVVRLMFDFAMVIIGQSDTQKLIEHTMFSLELVDMTMIANLIWYISAGSYFTFIAKHPFGPETQRPRCLTHVSAGLLKEKIASSIISIAAISLLRVLLDLAVLKQKVDGERVILILATFGILLLALLVYAHVNKQPHHLDHKD